jgi:hypothetical protein
MKTAIISASFLNFDNPHEWDAQPADIFRYTEKNFPLRKAITPHMQSKIPKCFGWQMNPGYDFYIYIDASYQVLKGMTEFMLSELGDKDIAVFPHPERKTIKEECDFLKDRANSHYVIKRYSGEFMDAECQEIFDDKGYTDDLLLHAAIFIYKNNNIAQNMLKEWWYHISRYHLCDQLSFPYVLKNSYCKYWVIPKMISEVPFVKYERHRG